MSTDKDASTVLKRARAAIAAGRDPAAVAALLQSKYGINLGAAYEAPTAQPAATPPAEAKGLIGRFVDKQRAMAAESQDPAGSAGALGLLAPTPGSAAVGAARGVAGAARALGPRAKIGAIEAALPQGGASGEALATISRFADDVARSGTGKVSKAVADKWRSVAGRRELEAALDPETFAKVQRLLAKGSWSKVRNILGTVGGLGGGARAAVRSAEGLLGGDY